MSKNDYRFVDKDPVVDVVRAAFARKGNLSHTQIQKVAYDSGVSASAINGWLFGDVRRPWSLSTRFVLEALGVEIGYTFDDGTMMFQPKVKLIPKTEQQKILKKDADRILERNKKRKAKRKTKSKTKTKTKTKGR
jgi:transcriptional regulator with XRE-family HTH domain